MRFVSTATLGAEAFVRTIVSVFLARAKAPPTLTLRRSDPKLHCVTQNF